MDDLEKAYELCKKKSDRHMGRLSSEYVHEYVACKDGLYSEPESHLNHMYNWTTSFITGLAPLMYRDVAKAHANTTIKYFICEA